MPGWEIINHKEKNKILEIFSKSNGVLFAHGFDERRKKIFRVREFEKQICKFLKLNIVSRQHRVLWHSILRCELLE